MATMTLDEAIKHAEEVMDENLEKTKGRNASDPIAINCFECADNHRQLAEWLKELKQLKEQTRWIPLSERLPEDRREVLITAYWHETYQVMVAQYYGDGWWWCVPFNNCGEHMQRLKPKAWMPLPKIYNGGGKTGKWINGDCEGGNCSICGKYYAFYPESGDFNYCPNCGAKMQEAEE